MHKFSQDKNLLILWMAIEEKYILREEIFADEAIYLSICLNIQTIQDIMPFTLCDVTKSTVI